MASQASTVQFLCKNCQGIRLDDGVLDGFAGQSEDGYPVLEFESGREPKRVQVVYYEDLLPDLSGLLQSHQDTQCAFCRYLREAILRANIEVGPREILISVQYRWFTEQDEENLSCLSVALTSVQGRWKKYLFFKVESNEVDVASWLGIHRCPEPAVWCPENIEWVQDLLETTDNAANSSTIPRGLPTRLIDVGETWTCSPRIMHTADLGEQRVRYCALSYCWGGQKMLRRSSRRQKSRYRNFASASQSRR
uniref:Uncharacterized protein n=1 Tax=Bionectria ochroleuca TaxID=29856 RepID=A0A8H7N2I6_BIOOC